MAGDDNRKWVYGKVEEETHSALFSIASELGVHFTKVVEEAMDRFVVEYAKELGDNTNPLVYARMMTIEDRQQRLIINQIKQLAYSFAEFPTDDNFDRLKSVCDRAGINVETVLEEQKDSPHIAQAIRDLGMLGKAEMWLLENMEPGKLYSSMEVIAAAGAAGIKEYVLKQAKVKVGVASKKDRKQWNWILEKATENPAPTREPEEPTF